MRRRAQPGPQGRRAEGSRRRRRCGRPVRAAGRGIAPAPAYRQTGRLQASQATRASRLRMCQHIKHTQGTRLPEQPVPARDSGALLASAPRPSSLQTPAQSCTPELGPPTHHSRWYYSLDGEQAEPLIVVLQQGLFRIQSRPGRGSRTGWVLGQARRLQHAGVHLVGQHHGAVRRHLAAPWLGCARGWRAERLLGALFPLRWRPARHC